MALQTAAASQPSRRQPLWILALVYLAFILVVFLYLLIQQATLFVDTLPGLFLLAFGMGVIHLGCTAWILLQKRLNPAGQLLAVLLASIGMGVAGFPVRTTGFIQPAWTLAVAAAGAGFLHLGMIFPTLSAWVTRRPWLQFLPWAAAGLLAVGMLAFRPPAATRDLILVGFAGLSTLFLLLRLRFNPAAGVEREQARAMSWSILLSYLPLALWLVVYLAARPNLTYAYFLVPLMVFPVAAGYIIHTDRRLRMDVISNRAMVYGALGILVALGYALLVTGLGIIFADLLPPNSPWITGMAVFILALLFHPLRRGLQATVDRFFFQGGQVYQDLLKTFSGELTEAVDLDTIVQTLRQYLVRSLQPGSLHIFLYDSLSDTYIAAPDSTGRSTSDLRFSPMGPLVGMLRNEKEALVLDSLQSLPSVLQPEEARLRLLNTLVFVPMQGRQRLLGWIALGQRSLGEPYTAREIGFLDSLSDQAALATERTQVVNTMQRRMQEINMLSRVAQGVNVTINMDDIYELTYAQVMQVIPADDVRLMLMDATGKKLVQVFRVHQDERLVEQENIVILPGQALEHEVIRQRKAILTDDYNHEAQRRGMLLPAQPIFAWLSVPLNTGAKTIGALSLGSVDPASTFTHEQQNLLQSVADQVAGAIEKSRLLVETERRARQLTTLNEVTRQLTSTLDLEPLLKNILHNAVEILDCEAGSLVMVDPQTDELVFRVVEGVAAEKLLGTRMPPGSGMVGKSVRTHQPIIVDNVTDNPEWFSRNDQATGFITRALLVVPLEVKDTVIGVVEVINHRDGSPFTQDDQDLLMAFAAQAAVALENARLYTLTDQALAERVEELSVMQRIDRELNTSLEPARAMRITLEWAMRQSGAAAGLIGLLEGDGLKIMSAQGYSDELGAYQETLLPLTAFGLDVELEGGQPLRRKLLQGQSGVLRTARSQVILPIHREGHSIGMILMESPVAEGVSDEVLGFLGRLSDHAAIAIANAQLYAAVQAANVAKSEFVSFVAHELKNPMTSIKGYTELLAAGAVGPVTEPQANFLATIRSNIDRMNTLISDLNDNSKIEAGRMRLEFQAIPLAGVVDEVLRSLRKQMDEKNQAVTVTIPEDLPSTWADRTRLMQVLVNLVSNAYKYTERDGQITVGAERCENRWDPDGATEVVHIWVQDTGIGIAPEDQPKIFQKFFRSEDPKTREAPGTGLGLNITRSLVEMQGGKIWFESEFRKGTTFHFTVPVAQQ